LATAEVRPSNKPIEVSGKQKEATTMTINDILNILDELGVECDELSAGSTLGDDAAMDSQEIVELRGLIVERFGLSIPKKALSKKSTVADVLKAAEEAKAGPTPAFDGTLETSLEINCNVDTAYRALFELAGWTTHLPHVNAVTVLYDDGTFQEFLMNVASPAGQIKVRSIRRCSEGLIEFFQPQPPKFLRHHSGGWRFQALSDNRCRVATFHRWNLEPEPAKQAFPAAAKTTEQQVEELLLEHAKVALNTWKDRIEAGQLTAVPELRRVS
jgi:acyl carrier protein